MRILVICPSGQSGQALRKLAGNSTEHELIFVERIQVDISNSISIKSAFKKHSPDMVIHSTDIEILEMMCSKKGIYFCNIHTGSSMQQIRKKIESAKVRRKLC